ncbi:MAG: MFS transporter [Gammaproteobacteria bacterium]|nr:MFS transporter [Gammaproteobacteria bacterium]
MPEFLQKAIGRLFKIERDEIAAAMLSFLFVFTLMASYYVLRPVRDAMASDWSDAELSWLWTLTFFISGAAVLLYGWVVSRVSLKKLVPAVYIFFAASFGLFYLATQSFDNTRLIDQSFYVWVSFFALFHISVFWSFMSDLYSSAQSKRLFGLFGAGASIGAVAGPLLPVLLGERIGVYNLLLIAALMLLLIIPIIFQLERYRQSQVTSPAATSTPAKVIGGDFFDGFIDLLCHRFLLAIALFLLLYTMMSSFVYFELKNVMAEYDRATRSQYWGLMDLVVNTLSILTAVFVTSRLATRFGLAVTLALVPLLLVFGWLAVAIAPGLLLLIGLQIVRRAGNYAITRPGREMLFTRVAPATRFKTKPVIDIVVYRGGDVLAGWTYTGLAQGIGLGLGAIAMVAALLAVMWTLVAVFLGVSYENHQNRAQAPVARISET